MLDFLRYAKDKNKLKQLVENEPYYKSMDEEAYDVIANYANVKKLVEVKDEYKEMGGKMNMCTAIREMMEDSKTEGRAGGISLGESLKLESLVAKKLGKGDTVEKIADDLVESVEVIRQIVKKLQSGRE